ncbi:unnamed protein product [Prorocentrum cordatum]|uniref:Uncharacterized protein n=1 Tax=Prorocentrum cordatum TaxID=2364126 RepID=A0ABN9WYE3_9DINO|nr:unnamed protein product [Polarella glacialis]
MRSLPRSVSTKVAMQIDATSNSIMFEFASYKTQGDAPMAAIEAMLESIQVPNQDAVMGSGADANGQPRQDPWAAFGAPNKTEQLEGSVKALTQEVRELKKLIQRDGVGHRPAGSVGSANPPASGDLSAINDCKRGTFPRCITSVQKTAHFEQFLCPMVPAYLFASATPQLTGASKSYGPTFSNAAGVRSFSESMSDRFQSWQGPRTSSSCPLRGRQDLPIDVRAKHRAGSRLWEDMLSLVTNARFRITGSGQRLPGPGPPLVQGGHL